MLIEQAVSVWRSVTFIILPETPSSQADQTE